jgi:diaminohydroxyphosphoribosylaminopyrimidine deaminase/5-amino-6-(5-phosphoribosylamino)uracil reductase
MELNEKYMHRCLELARLGAGDVAPNPMVGSVIVYNGKIIGEGYHRKYGGPHAEVNAINAVSTPEILKKSTLYVSLEPCAHYGLTPPCSDLIIEKEIPEVIIGTVDPFSEVAGKGIEKLEKVGVKVTLGVLEKDCRELNKRFFTFHERKRPYVILKWAQTIDGFIDVERSPESFGEPTWITGDLALQLVHKIRSEESAILVGTNTAEKDNPSLTVRHWPGENPYRLVLDKKLRLPGSLNLLNGLQKTLVFNARRNGEEGLTSFVKIDSEKEILPQILAELYQRNILSVIVEGGRQLLESFFYTGLWDEAHVFIGETFFYNGIRAPQIKGKLVASETLGNDQLKIFKNPFQK